MCKLYVKTVYGSWNGNLWCSHSLSLTVYYIYCGQNTAERPNPTTTPLHLRPGSATVA